MLPSLGFDTVIVRNRAHDADSLSALFELLYPCGIRNFIFLADIDLATDALSLMDTRVKNFYSHLKSVTPRGVHVKIFYNLILDRGAAFNKDIKRLYADKKHSALFVTLPIMLDSNYDAIANDVNQLLYRRKVFPIFTDFNMTLETSSYDFCLKLVNDVKAGFGIDVNYLFDPKNIKLAESLLRSGAKFIPTISHELSDYVGIMNEADFFMEKIGKNSYYRLCSLITGCSVRVGC